MNKKIILISLLVIAGLFIGSVFLNTNKEIVNAPVSQESQNINVNFIVQDFNGVFEISEGSTAYDLMNIASSTGAITFKAKNYSGIGYFFEEIYNIKNANGYYWTLYVNGEYSEVGASDYVLKDSDSIEWKFEKK